MHDLFKCSFRSKYFHMDLVLIVKWARIDCVLPRTAAELASALTEVKVQMFLHLKVLEYQKYKGTVALDRVL